ncbi:hypothetical protein JHD48_09190 [Sulfurimonas sp. SAG-AH-194-I05]|nr:hypothetical protein [Sulfurimonas sp. SAG-AH-194-I05]MDF1875908.1 hypothetical protein [Sulfurimonas sp. SAG-AH-194-I05]
MQENDENTEHDNKNEDIPYDYMNEEKLHDDICDFEDEEDDDCCCD